mmetsp:Transcript_19901/g.42975  ORF Transcript_19901/g.42975 Transcript_19901/m.42975 type:complete len:223 (-) Transcript_19901:756-1424(-)
MRLCKSAYAHASAFHGVDVRVRRRLCCTVRPCAQARVDTSRLLHALRIGGEAQTSFLKQTNRTFAAPISETKPFQRTKSGFCHRPIESSPCKAPTQILATFKPSRDIQTLSRHQNPLATFKPSVSQEPKPSPPLETSLSARRFEGCIPPSSGLLTAKAHASQKDSPAPTRRRITGARAHRGPSWARHRTPNTSGRLLPDQSTVSSESAEAIKVKGGDRWRLR